MAKLKISDYSSTSAGANLNTDINSIDIDEGCAPSGINNAIRTLMAQLKDFQTGVSGDSLTLGGALSGTSATFSGNVTASAISGASMTLSGDLTVDTNTLYVDSANNKVGIGTSSPNTRLTVNTTGVNGLEIADTSGNASGRLFFTNNTSGQATVIRMDQGDMLFNTGATIGSSSGTERMRINSSGNVLVGTTTAEGKVTINAGSSSYAQTIIAQNGLFGIGIRNTSGTGSWQATAFFTDGSQVGGINCSSTATTYATSSDYRLKNNVLPMSGSIDRLKQLKPSTWSWVQDGSHGEGFLAHEAQTVVPEAVTGTKDAVDDEGNPVYQGIDQSKLVPLLTAALQEAITKIENLEARIQTLENK